MQPPARRSSRFADALTELEAYLLPTGTEATAEAGPRRPDAIAWAVLALEAAGRAPAGVARGRDALATHQLADGRVSIDSGHPAAAWPTPLAVLAWHGAAAHREPRGRAIAYLLDFTGLRLPPDPALGHDTTLVGWPWVDWTHSWVEPTAHGLMALTLNHLGDHPRAEEARRLLLDRRLPQGGWNYGNTTVFGQELLPALDSTGVALAALAGIVEAGQVRNELDYVRRELGAVRSPLSLAWGLLGTSAWGERPPHALEWIGECLGRQQRLGRYDSALVAQVLLAAEAERGLLAHLQGKGG